ncbi:MAG: polysaccharide deacetylase family protein [Bacteroidota bacterium]|nr:polysaccharide deacetylase family protein [Flavisolibacter sp.]MDQ3842910.1 polysaccharide deacetylase family protein [Bacteroidota bacterium]
MQPYQNYFLVFLIFILCHCTQDKKAYPESIIAGKDTTSGINEVKTAMNTVIDTAAIWERKEIPVLCYHHIRDFKPNESASMKGYIVQVQAFKDQMKMLADSGYHTILPDQYYTYLTTGAPLPSKPFMITFDDTDEEQYSIGAAEMNKYGFKGVYFIMTISIGRPRYMSREQLKQLSDEGHVIGAHTWDHHKVTEYTDTDWDKQLTQSMRTLEDITGKKVEYFAYPFGVWNPSAFPELKKRGIEAAFQLSTKRNRQEPLYTLRRMLVHGTWDANRMLKWMNINF